MSEAGSDNKAPEKRMSKDGFFPTPIYFTDLADAKELNEQLKKDIRAWRERDPQGTVRSNVAQAGAWHSSTDMHTRSEFNPLTLEIFEMVQGIYDDLGKASWIIRTSGVIHTSGVLSRVRLRSPQGAATTRIRCDTRRRGNAAAGAGGPG